MSTPPGVAQRNVWGPILFKYCQVEYNQETRKLEIMKGKFVGKCKPTRHWNLGKDLKCDYDAFGEGDYDEEEEEEKGDDDDDDVDNDHGQVPDVVFADDIFQGLCFLF